MKVAMIGQKGIPTLYGGIERHVEEVSCRLAKKKNYQIFVYARGYYTPKRIKKYKGVNIITLPSIRTKHLDTISHVFFASIHAILKVRPDLIHYHGVGPALCLWLPKLFSKSKIIFTFHCRDYFHQKWGQLSRVSLKIGEIIGCRLADEVICVSLELQKYTKSKYSHQSFYIPHGVNETKHTPAKLIKKWDLSKNNYILTVSRLIPHKGVHYLISAYKKIKTDKKLVIVGPPFYTEKYQEKLKKLAGDDPNILFLGPQKGKTLRELYSNAWLFINSSEYEGLPLTVMEAGSFGRPLLLSDISPHKQIFDDLSFFFRNKNAKNLSENLNYLLKNPYLLSQRARKIKKHGIENYHWDKIVERIVLRYA